MKNLYPKSKGKIYPSPAPPSAGGGGGHGDALAVLRLLPAAIFALTVALAAEDKEVVAYLMFRSINGSGPSAESTNDRRRCKRTGGGGGTQRPLFDCGCFDCYTSFWSRWDCSKDRESIHMVIEAFEEHLASKEKKGKESKRKRKKSKDERREKEKAKKEKAMEMEREADEKMVMVEFIAAPISAEESKGFEDEAVMVSDECFADEKEEETEKNQKEAESAAEIGERRRGWAELVGGMLSSRLFNLWNSSA